MLMLNNGIEAAMLYTQPLGLQLVVTCTLANALESSEDQDINVSVAHKDALVL